MYQKLPSLNAIMAFESAARLHSFTAAAREMHVTQGAISRQVKNLEETLGRQLFKRLHRRIQLTDEGYLLAVAAGKAFTLIKDALEQMTADVDELRLKVQASFAILRLIPHIQVFQDRHPDLQLRLTTSTVNVDFDREDFDAGITYGRIDGKHIDHTLIHTKKLTPVCSPILLEGKYPLKKVEDLKNHRLLHNALGKHDWRSWAESIGLESLDWRSGEVFDTDSSALLAAVFGYGVALGDLYLVNEYLTSGRLIKPFDLPAVEVGSYYFVFQTGTSKKQAITKLNSWLLDLI